MITDETVKLPQAFYPWRRFWARSFDLLLYQTLWLLLIALGFGVLLVPRTNVHTFFDAVVAMLLMLVLEPLWLAFFGTTPGKAIFGLAIRNQEGQKLTYKEARERTWAVFGSGLGYAIPFYQLYRMWRSFKQCSENETLEWDLDLAYSIQDTRAGRGWLLAAAQAALLAILVFVMLFQNRAPQRGDLTVADFVRNYEHYQKLLEVDFGPEYLDEEGKWQEKEFNGSVYIDLLDSPTPVYEYQVEEGILRGVHFEIELRNHEGWLSTYRTHKMLVTLALAGAQAEAGFFGQTAGEASRTVSELLFEDYAITTAGVQIENRLENRGYLTADQWGFIPDDDAAEQYFYLEFSVRTVRD